MVISQGVSIWYSFPLYFCYILLLHSSHPLNCLHLLAIAVKLGTDFVFGSLGCWRLRLPNVIFLFSFLFVCRFCFVFVLLFFCPQFRCRQSYPDMNQKNKMKKKVSEAFSFFFLFPLLECVIATTLSCPVLLLGFLFYFAWCPCLVSGKFALFFGHLGDHFPRKKVAKVTTTTTTTKRKKKKWSRLRKLDRQL